MLPLKHWAISPSLVAQFAWIFSHPYRWVSVLGTVFYLDTTSKSTFQRVNQRSKLGCFLDRELWHTKVHYCVCVCVCVCLTWHGQLLNIFGQRICTPPLSRYIIGVVFSLFYPVWQVYPKQSSLTQTGTLHSPHAAVILGLKIIIL